MEKKNFLSFFFCVMVYTHYSVSARFIYWSAGQSYNIKLGCLNNRVPLM